MSCWLESGTRHSGARSQEPGARSQEPGEGAGEGAAEGAGSSPHKLLWSWQAVNEARTIASSCIYPGEVKAVKNIFLPKFPSPDMDQDSRGRWTSTKQHIPLLTSLPPSHPLLPIKILIILPLLLIHQSQHHFMKTARHQATNKKKLVLVLSNGKYYFVIAIHIKQKAIVFPIIQSYNAKFSW